MKRVLEGMLLSGLFLVFVASGCGTSKPRATTQAPAAQGEHPGDVSMHGEPQGKFLVAPDQQRRWAYASMPAPEPSGKPNYLLKSIGFDRGKPELDAEARGALRELAATLMENTAIQVVVIGFCDQGSEKVNADNLGIARAQNARSVLTSAGVAKERVEAASYGSSLAKAAEGDPIGQENDRRVEVWLIRE